MEDSSVIEGRSEPSEQRIVKDGLAFGEGPGWHDGRLWLSDMHAHQVLAVGLNGQTEVMCEVPTGISEWYGHHARLLNADRG